MSLWSFLKLARCGRCLHENESLGKQWAEIENPDSQFKALELLRLSLLRQSHEIDTERALLKDRENIFKQRELLIEDGKKLIAEKEALLSKQEATLWAEKEKMLGQDIAGIKRDILLPSLQQRWEAEKMKLDAERIRIIQSTPKVYESLESKKIELEKIIATIRSKPSSSPNEILLAENGGRLRQLLEIMAIADANDGTPHAA